MFFIGYTVIYSYIVTKYHATKYTCIEQSPHHLSEICVHYTSQEYSFTVCASSVCHLTLYMCDTHRKTCNLN